MFKCFKKRPPRETVAPNPTGNVFVALIVGHNKRAQGADNYLGESEWVFNQRIAKKVQILLNGIGCAILLRPSTGGYSHECKTVSERAKELGVTHAVSLHFNSAGEGARGCEVLVTKTSTLQDDLFADIITDMLNERYGFRERGNDGVKTISSSHNGAGMLNALNKKGIVSCLVEPCFADYRTEESKVIFENEDAYAEVLALAIRSAWMKS